ncbi:MAG: sigma factor-like helix-turn-helix DNA-binding protein, partial [Planctomycetota bacterium]
PAGDVSVGQGLELGEDAKLADAHLGQLKPDEQRVLRLSIYDSLSHAAIADRTGLPLGTVKSHIRRGLDSLRDKLAKRDAARHGRLTAGGSDR